MDPRPGAAEHTYENMLKPMQRFWVGMQGHQTPEEKAAASKELIEQLDTR